MLLKLINELAKKITASPSEDPEEYCIQCTNATNFLPKNIFEALHHFSIHGSETGFLLLHGGRVEDMIHTKTPTTNNEKVGEKTDLAKIQGILVSAIGNMVAYEAEGYGRLYQDIIPMQSMEKVQTSVSSAVELEIHTEQAFSRLRPDILCLACIRGNEQAFTYILPVKYILNNMTPREIELLRKPMWKISVDLSFKLCGQEFIDGDIRGPIPIIYGTEEDPLLVFDQDLMTGIDEESHAMITRIVDIYYQHRIGHSLKPGEIILVDNNRAVHGRSPFTPKYDGYDRFLIRCFSMFDYEKSAYARKAPHTIGAIYS
jgi:L-asparagine oxygenase